MRGVPGIAEQTSPLLSRLPPGYDQGMPSAPAFFGTVFGAWSIWLTVQAVNRGWRPRRLFWIITIPALIVGYPLSYGPLTGAFAIGWISENEFECARMIYGPIAWTIEAQGSQELPDRCMAYIGWWVELGIAGRDFPVGFLVVLMISVWLIVFSRKVSQRRSTDPP
jgi:hypothetical protein